MSNRGTVAFKTRTEAGTERVWFYCPGCECYHAPNVKLGAGESGPVWEWNGSLYKPSFHPSIRAQSNVLCHSWVKDGQIEFLPDSTHRLAGQTVDLEVHACHGSA